MKRKRARRTGVEGAGSLTVLLAIQVHPRENHLEEKDLSAQLLHAM